MKQDKICQKSQRKKKKETPPDQSQPSANPSASFRTPPNPNLQQSVDFASHQNGEFTLQ